MIAGGTGTLSARGVRVHLGGRSVVDGVDLDAAPGQLTAVVGPNGSGKTSFLRALAGLIDFEGRVAYGDRDLALASAAERARWRAYLPQRSALDAMLSVRDVVAMGRYARLPGPFARLGRADREAVERALERTALSGVAARPYPKLSGGEQRRVLLARALASGAPALLLDEPGASLDLEQSLALFELLGELAREGRTIVCALHDLDDVQRYTAFAILLDRGRARAAAAPRSDAFCGALEDVYRVQLVEADRVGFRRRPQAEPARSS